MALQDVKIMFVEASGRRDLDTASRHGAIWFINAGQRMLDNMCETHKSLARCVVSAPANAMYVSIDLCRAISKVWVVDSTVGRTQLLKSSVSSLRAAYPQLFGDISGLRPGTINVADASYAGLPCWYAALADNVASFQNDILTQPGARTNRLGFDGMTQGDTALIRTIMIVPPTDEARSVEVEGYFYSKELREDFDTSFWTDVHPELLVKAACYQLEVFMRNFTGSQAVLAAIQMEAVGVSKNVASESCEDSPEMEG